MFLRQLRLPVFSTLPLIRNVSDTTFKPAVRAAARIKERLGPQPSPLSAPTMAAPREGAGPGSLVKSFGGVRASGESSSTTSFGNTRFGGGSRPGGGMGGRPGGGVGSRPGGGGGGRPGSGGAGAGGAQRKPAASSGSRGRDMVKTTTLTESTGLMTRVVHIGRVSRMTSQGRKTQFRALVIMGNGNGAVGFGVGKGLNPRSALTSAVREGEKDLVVIDIAPWGSLYHDVMGYCNNTKVMIRAIPAHKWYATAGKLMRAIMECAGIRMFSCRILGRRNPFSVVNAAFDALGHHQTPKEIALKRGRKLVDTANPDLFESEHVH